MPPAVRRAIAYRGSASGDRPAPIEN
jgi:hypothetical protein